MGQPTNTFALTHTVNQTQKLYAVSLAAQTQGLIQNMSLAEARAIVPALDTAPANEDADARALNMFARWCDRYTPLFALDGADGLLLDITGCDHLFGGEQALIDDLSHRMEKAGIIAQFAIADTVGSAWALARYAPGYILPKSDIQEKVAALNSLPVKALRLDRRSVVTLHRLGLKRIGDLTKLPRPALARRFRGAPAKDVTDLLNRLDQALGTKAEAVVPLQPLPVWRLRHAFSEPVMHLEAIELALPTLINNLMPILAQAEMGVRRLILSAFRVDGSVQHIRIGTSRPTRDQTHLKRLFTEKLDTLQSGFGFDLLMLSVSESEKLPPKQIATLRDTQMEETAHVLDRLSARLGAGAVIQLKHRHSHIPERAQSYSPAYNGPLEWETIPQNLAPRPLRLLPHPEAMQVMAEVPEGAPRRFRWRRVNHRVLKAEGPERLACEWWLTGETETSEDLTRDYYRIEVEGGARFWVFRRGLYAVAGVRPAETIDDPLNGTDPQWFMHGFFA